MTGAARGVRWCLTGIDRKRGAAGEIRRALRSQSLLVRRHVRNGRSWSGRFKAAATGPLPSRVGATPR
jgi:hypothetical protein